MHACVVLEYVYQEQLTQAVARDLNLAITISSYSLYCDFK